MIIKYIGTEDYIDERMRFVAKTNDLIDIDDAEAEDMILTGNFEHSEVSE